MCQIHSVQARLKHKRAQLLPIKMHFETDQVAMKAFLKLVKHYAVSRVKSFVLQAAIKSYSKLLYFFDYKSDFFSLPKQSQTSRSILLDGSRCCKMDLDVWDCLGRTQFIL